MNKKGALELSIGTIVIIVIAMAMLILGLVLVKNIFSGATSSVNLIDDKVKGEIKKLFEDDDRRVVVYLSSKQADVTKGEEYNIGFAVKNVLRGDADATTFAYKVEASEVEPGCEKDLSLATADTYIRLGKEVSSFQLVPGAAPQDQTIIVRLPDNAPLCFVRYNINVYQDRVGGSLYASDYFILNIEA